MTTIIILIFLAGYLLIALEHPIRINKASIALIAGVLCWATYALMGSDNQNAFNQLGDHFADIAGILFFLLGAMVIVQLIDAHEGFDFITEWIGTRSRKKLLWILGFIAFFLSAVLDNLTTTIVMISLVRKLIPSREDRLYYTGLIIIAANAGGAWSPIGDVTTTMLWMGKQVTTTNIILKTIIPSLVCFLIPAFLISLRLKGTIQELSGIPVKDEEGIVPLRHRKLIFSIGLGALLFVPVFKVLTGLPPYMGILFGLGIMWLTTEIIHGDKDKGDKGNLSVSHALMKIDTPSILFFLGILLSVAALQATGILTATAAGLDRSIGNINIITIITGFLSAIIDNVPLVAAVQGMYPLSRFPTDHSFWELLAFCAGTGGSMLIIGSAAGVAAMGMEKIRFFDYLKKIGWIALLGYLAGAGTYLLLTTA